MTCKLFGKNHPRISSLTTTLSDFHSFTNLFLASINNSLHFLHIKNPYFDDILRRFLFAIILFHNFYYSIIIIFNYLVEYAFYAINEIFTRIHSSGVPRRSEISLFRFSSFLWIGSRGTIALLFFTVAHPYHWSLLGTKIGGDRQDQTRDRKVYIVPIDSS